MVKFVFLNSVFHIENVMFAFLHIVFHKENIKFAFLHIVFHREKGKFEFCNIKRVFLKIQTHFWSVLFIFETKLLYKFT